MKIGIQLYSVRNEASANLPETLEKLAKMGYEYIEFAGYYGYEAKQIRQLLDGLGLKCISSHLQLSDITQSAAEYLAVIGASYAAIPYIPQDKLAGSADYDNTVKSITEKSKILGSAGIKLLYHNHAHEFNIYDNRYLLDILYEDIPANLLQAQLDVCWIRYADVDPAGYIKKYGGRCPVIHLKDYIGDKKSGNFMFKPLGQGIVDIKSIIETSVGLGCEYFIVEQDSSTEKPPLTSAEESIKYLKNII